MFNQIGLIMHSSSVQQISLWDFLFSGQILTNVFIGIVLFLGIVALYVFFLKYFSLKEIYYNENDFLANVADCIYDHRIEAAKDWCKRIITPESRIIKKGLDKIEKSSFEMFIAVVNQREIEVLEMKKNLFGFGLLAKIVILLGFLGTGISLAFSLMREDIFSNPNFYTSFFPMSIGALLGVVIFLLKMILLSFVHKIEVNLKIKGNQFLEIVAESK